MGRALSLGEALPILAAHGLTPGADGFAAADLVAFLEGRGWTVSAERTDLAAPSRRWRATVFARRPQGGGGHVLLSGVTRHGATEGEALAMALASLLRRDRSG
jgi:hypothetical protein